MRKDTKPTKKTPARRKSRECLEKIIKMLLAGDKSCNDLLDELNYEDKKTLLTFLNAIIIIKRLQNLCKKDNLKFIISAHKCTTLLGPELPL